jgi:hypothetical protein
MITEELKQRLQTETPRIRELARLSGDEAVFKYKKNTSSSPLESLMFRMSTVMNQRNVLIASHWIQAQAEVAAIHGLGYLKDGKRNRWVDVTDPSLTEEDRQYIVLDGKRSENYFIEWESRFDDVNKDPDKSITLPKVDLALLAHACQLPLDSFLFVSKKSDQALRSAEYARLINQYIQLTREGKNLFTQDTGFLDQFSNAARGRISVYPLEPEENSLQEDLRTAAEAVVNPVNANPRPSPAVRGMRGAVSVEPPRRASGIRAGAMVSVSINPPEEYQKGCELVALEKDSLGTVTLISSAMNLDGTTRFVEDEFVIPRLIKQAEGEKPAKLAFDCEGRSRIYVLMLKHDPNADTVLHTLPSFNRTTEEAYARNRQAFDTRFDEADFAELRKILLQRDQKSWMCLHHDLQILPANS